MEHETIVTKIDEIIGEHVYNRTVTLFQKDVATCTCCFHHQYLMVCPHIIRAMNHLVIMKEITSNERIKITESFFPDFLKINTIVQRMWRSNFETKIPSDLYEVVDKVQSSSVVLAPPAYKNVSMGGQKRRYMSKGELKMGKYVTYSAKPIKKQRYTSNSAHTKVKYYSSNELNMYYVWENLISLHGKQVNISYYTSVVREHLNYGMITIYSRLQVFLKMIIMLTY